MEETLNMVNLVSSGTKVGNDWRKPRAGGSRNWWLHCGFGSNSRWSEKRTLWKLQLFVLQWKHKMDVAHSPPRVLFSFVFNNWMNVLLNKALMCNFRSVCFYNCKLFMLSSNNAGPIFCNYSFPTKYNICQHFWPFSWKCKNTTFSERSPLYVTLFSFDKTDSQFDIFTQPVPL